MAARETGELSLPGRLSFCLLLAKVTATARSDDRSFARARGTARARPQWGPHDFASTSLTSRPSRPMAEGVKRMQQKANDNGGATAEVFEQLAVLEAENEQHRTALGSPIILEQAKGAISVRCGVDPETAFEMIRGLARSQHREIHEYAAEIVVNGGRFSAKPQESQLPVL
jgi:hypothetical protein